MITRSSWTESSCSLGNNDCECVLGVLHSHLGSDLSHRPYATDKLLNQAGEKLSFFCSPCELISENNHKETWLKRRGNLKNHKSDSFGLDLIHEEKRYQSTSSAGYLIGDKTPTAVSA